MKRELELLTSTNNNQSDDAKYIQQGEQEGEDNEASSLDSFQAHSTSNFTFFSPNHPKAEVTLKTLQCLTPIDAVLLSEGTDLTGHTIWLGALVMCHFICRFPEAFERKTVIELGSGTGLAGLVAAQFSDCCVLTDRDPGVLQLLDQNIDLNVDKFLGSCTSAKLEWGIQNFSDGCFDNLEASYDVTIAADVIYGEEVVEPLWASINAFTKSEGKVYLSHVPRCSHSTISDMIVEEATKHKFHLLQKHRPESFINLSCFDHISSDQIMRLQCPELLNIHEYDACILEFQRIKPSNST